MQGLYDGVPQREALRPSSSTLYHAEKCIFAHNLGQHITSFVHHDIWDLI